MLKKYYDDENYIIHWDSVLLDENLSYEEEPLAILDKEVRKLSQKKLCHDLISQTVITPILTHRQISLSHNSKS